MFSRTMVYPNDGAKDEEARGPVEEDQDAACPRTDRMAIELGIQVSRGHIVIPQSLTRPKMRRLALVNHEQRTGRRHLPTARRRITTRPATLVLLSFRGAAQNSNARPKVQP